VKTASPPAWVPDHRDWLCLGLAALLPLAATLLLFALNIPLGKPGTLTYPYSPIWAARQLTLPWLLPGAVLLGLGVWLLCRPPHGAGAARRASAAYHRFGLVTLAAGTLATGLWVFVAPPCFVSQHCFNMISPSHDGAFLNESLTIDDVRAYLRAFPQRARTPPEEMRGTRVISNPPGTTLLAVGVRRLLTGWPALAGLIDRTLIGVDAGPPPQRARMVLGLAFALALWQLWLLAGVFLYLAMRQFLEPGPAAVLAGLCLFSPAALVFTPGKDPAQLLTAALPLWTWLIAWRRRSPAAAGASGALLVAVCLVSLVHVWLAVIVAVACAAGLVDQRGQWRVLVLRVILPAAGGALAAGAVCYGAGLDLLAALRAVAHSQALVTRGPGAMPLIWQALGVPLFGLFAGAGFWAALLWLTGGRRSDGLARFGLVLVIAEGLVMILTVGFTNIETPRLWIPFMPLLVLGLALQLPQFREPTGDCGDKPVREARGRLLAALLLVHVLCAAVQWTYMDMRETEMRLLEQPDGGARFFE
jgi:hypothetical protein